MAKSVARKNLSKADLDAIRRVMLESVQRDISARDYADLASVEKDEPLYEGVGRENIVRYRNLDKMQKMAYDDAARRQGRTETNSITHYIPTGEKAPPGWRPPTAPAPLADMSPQDPEVIRQRLLRLYGTR